MADAVSSSDLQAMKPPSKRRRILNPSAIVPVPVYSSRVEKIPALLSAPVSPSELNRKLRAVSSTLSPMPRNRRTRERRTQASDPDDDDDDDDVIFMSPMYSSDSLREIPLKIRCRTDVHKVLVLPVRLIPDVVSQLSIILKVPPPRLLLLKEELELPTDSSVGQLGLSIADIIGSELCSARIYSGVDPARMPNSRRGLTGPSEPAKQSCSNASALHQEVPLSSIFSQYLSKLPARAHRKVRFHFDGSKVTGCQTPAQLDLEDGDIIEVWT
ncbi:hypothetical protein GOODEAATRI_028054 [Goodea atripinnis]|uniref:NFATC2-interacting protein n=1 Tax=Goodea atripinnis TaxID=208336 RepID=A0ABV0PHQ7_9TELE